ncbi:putative aldouronate transport system permease protein [Paenibacillus castaneae]|uniref:carbohydrate ABC transporter permease n=1 Tax=Paenibacillus castaneae TaxID=474957 RepID=UPI000C9BBF1A|nr:carbohydrate ABC transporter permease [Paenibacillus castaneae]NIK78310.1 putative aldouronate transport system permease protein [Paenibacillus castaneae]
MYYKTLPYRIFSTCNYVLLALVSILCLLPLYHLLMVSLSSAAPANGGLVTLWPIGLTFEAYAKTFNNTNFLSALWVSIQRTVLGTALAIFINTIAAYALSKDTRVFRARNIYLWYFVVTMLFSGGLIPSYILILKLGLMNSLFALILPGMIGVYNVILLLNFFRSIPKELEEAAFIDGAGYLRTFFNIFLPVSLPAIATISLFIMVGHWNSYFDGLIYIRDSAKLPLATFMQTIIIQADVTKLDPQAIANLSQRTIRASQIFIGALPILIVYPFLQRFFVKGIVIGAVKE